MVSFKLNNVSNQEKRISITSLADSKVSMHGTVNPTQQIHNGTMTLCLSAYSPPLISCDGATSNITLLNGLFYPSNIPVAYHAFFSQTPNGSIITDANEGETVFLNVSTTPTISGEHVVDLQYPAGAGEVTNDDFGPYTPPVYADYQYVAFFTVYYDANSSYFANPLSSLKEGGSFYLVVAAENIPDGTVLNLDYIQGPGLMTPDDFEGELPTSLVIENRKAAINYRIKADGLKDGEKQLRIELTDQQGVHQLTAQIVVKDTSTFPVGTWTLVDVPRAGISDILYVNNTYVAVGAQGLIKTSVDGVTWAEQVAPQNLADPFLKKVFYLNGRYFALSSKIDIITSTDAINWTLVKWGTYDPSVDYNKDWNLVYGNTGYLAGRNTTLYASADGLSWNPVSQPHLSYITNMTSIEGTYYLTGGIQNTDPWETGIITSTDLINWTIMARFIGWDYGSLRAVTQLDNGTLVTFLGSGILYSNDAGATWNYFEDMDSILPRIFTRTDEVVIVGRRNTYHANPNDLSQWQTFPHQDVYTSEFSAVIGENLSAIAGNNVIVTQDFGSYNLEISSGTFSKIVLGNDKFVLAGQGYINGNWSFFIYTRPLN